MKNQAKPKHRPTQYRNGHKEEKKAAELHKRLQEFEDFETEILPALRADVKSGMSAEQLRKKYESLVQARQITDALTAAAGKAAGSVKDLLDRTSGKPTEKKEVTHRFKDMSDAELDAVLASEEEDLDQMNSRFNQ